MASFPPTTARPGPRIVDASVPLTRSHSAPAAAEHSPEASPSRSGSRPADVNPSPLTRRAASAGPSNAPATLAQRRALPSVTIRFDAETPSSDAAAHGLQTAEASAAVQPWNAVARGLLIGTVADSNADIEDLAAALRLNRVQVRPSQHGPWVHPAELASPALNGLSGQSPGFTVVPPLSPRVSAALRQALNVNLSSALSTDRLAGALAAGLKAGEGAADAAVTLEEQRLFAWDALPRRAVEQGVMCGVTAGVEAALSAAGEAAMAHELRPLLKAAGINQGITAAAQKVAQVAPGVVQKACAAAVEAGLRTAGGILGEMPIHVGNAEQRLLTALNKGIESGLQQMAEPMISALLEVALQAGLDGDTIKPVLAPEQPASSPRAED
jgi:hypothetical protein